VVRRPHAPDMFYDLILRRWKAGTGIEDTYGRSYLPTKRPSAKRRSSRRRHGTLH
jgi:hypothetical protein